MTMNPTNQMIMDQGLGSLSVHNHLIRRIHRHQTRKLKERKVKRRKNVVTIEKMTLQTHPQVMTLIHPRTVIIDVDNAKIRNIGKKI